eukprot:1979570-Pyramimonas_sp.AAC.2
MAKQGLNGQLYSAFGSSAQRRRGKFRSSLDAREPQNATKSEEYQTHLQGRRVVHRYSDQPKASRFPSNEIPRRCKVCCTVHERPPYRPREAGPPSCPARGLAPCQPPLPEGPSLSVTERLRAACVCECGARLLLDLPPDVLVAEDGAVVVDQRAHVVVPQLEVVDGALANGLRASESRNKPTVLSRLPLETLSAGPRALKTAPTGVPFFCLLVHFGHVWLA